MARTLDVSSWNLGCAALLLAACGPTVGTEGSASGSATTGEGEPCLVDEDCGPDRQCRSGRCFDCYCGCYGVAPPPEHRFRCSPGYECYSDAECAEHHRCLGGDCVPDDPEPQPDVPLEDCPIPTPLGELAVTFTGEATAPVVGMITIDLDPSPGVELLVARGHEVQRVDGNVGTPILTAPAPIVAVAGGDIDDDGDIDLVTTEQDDGAVMRIWWGDAGGFVPGMASQPLAEGMHIALTEYDADTDLDVLVREGLTLRMYPTEGDAFGVPVDVAGIVDSFSIFDAEPDGLADLFYTRGDTLTLQPRPEVGEPTTRVLPGLVVVRGLAIGDFTADGVLDAFMIDYDGTGHGWTTVVGPLLHGGDAVTRDATQSFERPAVGELDGDGHADLVIAGGEHHLLVRYGWIPGNLETGPVEPFHCDYLLPTSLAVERAAVFDYDGDGIHEIAITDGADVRVLDF